MREIRDLRGEIHQKAGYPRVGITHLSEAERLHASKLHRHQACKKITLGMHDCIMGSSITALWAVAEATTDATVRSIMNVLGLINGPARTAQDRESCYGYDLGDRLRLKSFGQAMRISLTI